MPVRSTMQRHCPLVLSVFKPPVFIHIPIVCCYIQYFCFVSIHWCHQIDYCFVCQCSWFYYDCFHCCSQSLYCNHNICIVCMQWDVCLNKLNWIDRDWNWFPDFPQSIHLYSILIVICHITLTVVGVRHKINTFLLYNSGPFHVYIFVYLYAHLYIGGNSFRGKNVAWKISDPVSWPHLHTIHELCGFTAWCIP